MRAQPKKALANKVSLEDRMYAARSHIKKIGIILSLYSSAIRAINSAPSILKTREPEKINKFAVNSALAPVRISPTLTDSFICAASEFYPEQLNALRLAQKEKLETRSVLKLFTAQEISSILAITYLFKLLNKVCDKEEFSRISGLISVQIYLGSLVGSQSGDNFGRGGGIAATGLRVLSLAVLMLANLKAFKKYRRLIEESSVLSHANFEVENFGCTHLDIATLLAGDLGYGAIAREGYINLQNGICGASTPDGILWNHTLVESGKLWAARQALRLKTGSVKSELEDSDNPQGVKWLWTHSSELEILPGLVAEDIAELIPNQQSEEDDYSLIHGTNAEITTDLAILIVEDEPSGAAILEKFLSPLGQICIKNDAESALEAISVLQQSLPFDLILLDVGLPGMSGLELLNKIREIESNRNVPKELRCRILMITGDENPQTVMKSYSHGADGYLTKPLKKDEIKEELARHNINLG